MRCRAFQAEVLRYVATVRGGGGRASRSPPAPPVADLGQGRRHSAVFCNIASRHVPVAAARDKPDRENPCISLQEGRGAHGGSGPISRSRFPRCGRRQRCSFGASSDRARAACAAVRGRSLCRPACRGVTIFSSGRRQADLFTCQRNRSASPGRCRVGFGVRPVFAATLFNYSACLQCSFVFLWDASFVFRLSFFFCFFPLFSRLSFLLHVSLFSKIMSKYH